MGTRNLTIVKSNNKLKVCQYGQWDGFPEGQGTTILKFCKDKAKMSALKFVIDNILDISVLTEYCEEYEKLAPAWSSDPDNRTEQMKYHFKQLGSRDIGGLILDNIINVDRNKLPQVMQKQIYLSYYDITDSVNYCDMWIEYAYVVNLDTNKLECYAYNHHLADFNLDKLPTPNAFCKKLNKLVSKID